MQAMAIVRGKPLISVVEQWRPEIVARIEPRIRSTDRRFVSMSDAASSRISRQ